MTILNKPISTSPGINEEQLDSTCVIQSLCVSVCVSTSVCVYQLHTRVCEGFFFSRVALGDP